MADGTLPANAQTWLNMASTLVGAPSSSALNTVHGLSWLMSAMEPPPIARGVIRWPWLSSLSVQAVISTT